MSETKNNRGLVAVIKAGQPHRIKLTEEGISEACRALIRAFFIALSNRSLFKENHFSKQN